MGCFYPLKGWKAKERDPKTGKRRVVFSPKEGLVDQPVTLPCGQCTGCRLERSRQWAIRCVHEAQLHEDNVFITLTYNDENLPEDLSVNVEHFQKFMKRLRKKKGQGIRFFHCGEYGDNLGRPHYHALLFNCDFEDKVLWKEQNGFKLFVSEDLNRLWGKGYCVIGDVTFESAAYTARYIMKKVNGSLKDDHYSWVDPSTGEIFERKPEYITMSRRPGIGFEWFKRFKEDVVNQDHVVLRGVEMKPPKYYDELFDLDNGKEMRRTKGARVRRAKERREDNTPERLRVKEKVLDARLGLLKRPLEER